MSSPLLASLPVEFGNAGSAATNGTGWFIGFSDWSKSAPHDLRHMPKDLASSNLCVKWYAHPAGDPNGEEKPVSTGRTISLLVSTQSRFRLDFSADPSFAPSATLTYWLKHAGDYAIWGAGIYHRAFGHEPATILTVRWEPGRSTA
ncbi:hypothetical protein [Pseudorhodoferax sp.]|uniref:hypothetical protein n=1 Tax=Pseudorhodoferax sp. TaxID=1993553 RepID=UPI0039E5E5BB